jgi:membrane protein
VLGYLLLAAVAAAIASTLYRFGPSREDAKWKWISPGSVFAAVAWLLLTWAFGIYVGRFTNYNASYGSLGAVVALLTWMYLSAYAFVFGAELNSEIEHQTATDSTTGSPEPLGDRGAWAADNVATDDTVQDRPEEQREGEKLTQAAPKVAEEKG